MTRMVIDTSAFDGEVRGLLARASDCSRPLKQWGVWMVGSVKKNFAAQGRPTKWRPLKVKTLLARYSRTAAARKLRDAAAAKGPRGKWAPSADVFKTDPHGKGGVGALSTVAGFARNKKGRVARNRSAGLNKFAKEGFVFRAAAVRAVLQGKILQDRGLLRASVTTASAVDAGPRKVTVGTNVVYAATHQFGDARRKIAARPFLVIQDEDEREFGDLVTRWLREGKA